MIAAAPAFGNAAYIPLDLTPVHSSIPYSTPQNFVYSGEIDVQQMARTALELQKTFAIDTSRYIPAYDMPDYSSSQSTVANKILKQTLQTWVEEKGSDLDVVKQAQKINDTLSTEIPVSAGNNDGGKFKVRLRPVSSEAQFRYEGSFNADLTYNVSDSSTKLTLAWNF